MKINNKVTNVLGRFGIAYNIRGFAYIKYAVQYVYEHNCKPLPVVKHIYPKVAEVFETTPSAAERAMRYYMQLIFEQGDKEWIEATKFYRIRMNGEKVVPTVGDGIYILANYLNTMEE